MALAYPSQSELQPTSEELETVSTDQQKTHHGTTLQPGQHTSPAKAAAQGRTKQLDESSFRDEGGSERAAPKSNLQASTAHPARNAAEIEGEYITVTGSAGERVYCGVKALEEGQDSRAQLQHHKRKGHFLEQPISVLMAEVEKHLCMALKCYT